MDENFSTLPPSTIASLRAAKQTCRAAASIDNINAEAHFTWPKLVLLLIVVEQWRPFTVKGWYAHGRLQFILADIAKKVIRQNAAPAPAPLFFSLRIYQCEKVFDPHA